MAEKPEQKLELSGYITGQFLLAMPHIQDPRFEKAVIYMCGHDVNGAMGLIINKYLGDFTLQGLLAYLNLPKNTTKQDLPIYFGGPVETGRGFVLHSDDFSHPSTVPLKDHISLTATIDILQAIAEGNGPQDCLLAMGYVGWEAGQLDTELHSNHWLQMDADLAVLFHMPTEKKWEIALKNLGITPEALSEDCGRA